MLYSTSLKLLLLATVLYLIDAAVIPSPTDEFLTNNDGYQKLTKVTIDDSPVMNIDELPADYSPNPVEIVKHTLVRRAGICDLSTFEGRTTSKGPFRDDCHALRGRLRAMAAGGYPVLALRRTSWVSGADTVLGTCRVAVQSNVLDAEIGTDDLADVIRDSVTRFSRYLNNVWRVEATGAMVCHLAGRPDPGPVVRWLIYRDGTLIPAGFRKAKI